MRKFKTVWSDWLYLCEELSSKQKQFLETIHNLDPEKREEKRMFGNWSTKDLLAHISGWEVEVVKMFKLFLIDAGIDDEYNIDSFNNESVNSRKELPWEEIIDELKTAQQNLNQFISTLSQKDIDSEQRFCEWTSVLITHYNHHTNQIKNVNESD